MWFGSSGLTEQERAGSSGCPVLPAPQPPPAGRDLPLCSWALRPQQSWVFFRTMAPSPAALLRFPKFPFKVSLSCLFRFLSLPLPWGDAESPDGSLHPPPPQTTRVAPRRKAETWARILFPPARLTRPSPASPSHTCAFPRGDGLSSALLSRPPLPLPVRVSLCSRVCRHPSASACSPSLCVCVHMRVCVRTCVCVRVHACCSISAPDERAVVSGFSASEASSWQAAVSPA